MSVRPRRAAAFVLALSLAAQAPAAVVDLHDSPPELTKGQVELHPRAGLSETYDSNIFLRSQAVSSWIFAQSYGLEVRAASPSDRHKLMLAYDGAHRDYSYSHDDALRNAFIHAPEARYWYRSPSDVTVRAREIYLNTIDPANSEQTNLRRRWMNVWGADVGYEPTERPLLLRAGAEQTRHKYVGDVPTLDRTETLFGVKAGWQFQPKTVLYTGYRRQLIHYTENPVPSRDSQGHLVDAGVEGELAPHTTGRVQAGVVIRSYDSAPAPGQSAETTNFTAEVGAVYLPDERTRAELTAARTLQPSEFDINQYYIATAAGLSLSREVLHKLRVIVNGGVEWDKYPTTTVTAAQAFNRSDQVYLAGAALEYPLNDRLKAGLGYLHRARFTNAVGPYPYRDHVTTLALDASW
jgi:hypothetical protein